MIFSTMLCHPPEYPLVGDNCNRGQVYRRGSCPNATSITWLRGVLLCFFPGEAPPQEGQKLQTSPLPIGRIDVANFTLDKLFLNSFRSCRLLTPAGPIGWMAGPSL